MTRTIKWRILLTTLPFVAAMLALSAVRDHVVGYGGFIDFSDMGAVLTAGAFLIGFMLSGTMADYKESEKLPADLACVLEGLDDHLAFCNVKTPIDLPAARARLVALNDAIEAWLHNEQPVATVFGQLTAFAELAHALDAAGSYHAGRITSEIHALRKVVTRIHVINTTSFLPVGYALLETMVGAIMVLLLAARWKSEIAEYTLIGFITLVYVYMVRLIKDVDSPFERTRHGQTGAAEVDLGALISFGERLRVRAATTVAVPALRALAAAKE